MLMPFHGSVNDADVYAQGLYIVNAGSTNIPADSCPYGGMLTTFIFGQDGNYMMQFLAERGATKGWFRVKSDFWRNWVLIE